MDRENSSEKNKSRKIWLILSAAALLLTVFFLARAFLNFKKHGFFAPPNYHDFHKKKLQTAEVESWMTFDFLNKAFGLPPEYLKNQLDISDKKYPNLTIDNLAKNTNENSGAMLSKVKKLVEDFQNPKPSEDSPGF